MLGFLNLNKPAGWTSHDCVARVRRLLHIRQVGHSGTLDPAATGVLPIAVGKVTRLLQFLPTGKTYHATIRFGVCTTTDDLEGDVIACQPAPHLTLDAVQAVLPRFLGVIQQVPPRYSALQVDGKRLYDLARAGQDVALQPRSVEIYRIDVLAWRSGEFPELEVAMDCGAGTYIRSIARDLGNLLQTGGTLAALIRTQSNGFRLENSSTLEELASGTIPLVAPELALHHLSSVHLASHDAQRWCSGQRLAGLSKPDDLSGMCRVHQTDGQFLGIGEWQAMGSGIDADWVLRPKVVL
jgi:tRNA pseudouridine55 synthase